MKEITKFFLIVAVLSGAVSFHTYRNGDSLTVETTISNPDEIVDTAIDIISFADDVRRSYKNKVTSQPDTNESNCEPVIYRIRNADCDAASQIGAYSNLDSAIQVCPAGYCVFDGQNQLIYVGGSD